MKITCELTNKIIQKLIDNNIECYVVGGYVRDYLLGTIAKDIDIELHNTTLEEAYAIISQDAEADIYGTFGIIALRDVETEFAIARTERKTGNNHTSFEVNFITNGDLKLAASRRDFTINSMMYDLKHQKLIDLYGGKHDLDNRILRHVSSAFSEDPLRVLRGLKFMTRYNLSIDEQTEQFCSAIADQLAYLPKSRIQNELEAIFSGRYYQNVHALLTKYLNIQFKQSLVNDYRNLELPNIIKFFLQFPDYSPVIEFCFERKSIKHQLQFTLDNYQHLVNFKTLSGADKFDLLKNIKETNEYPFLINPHIRDTYNYYQQLLLKYDGNYFIKQGISGKEIAIQQKALIGGLLDEL